MGRCDYFERECNTPGKCVECLNPKKTDMREKVKEYISELNREIDRCVSWMEEHIDSGICQVAAMEMRAKTLVEVVNGLESRLEELV